ncbi:MAG: hypothetical protein Kow0090_16820 [Myxococcota bacterium]
MVWETDDNFLLSTARKGWGGRGFWIKVAVVAAIAAIILAVGVSIVLSTMGIVGSSRVWISDNYGRGETVSLRVAMIDEYYLKPVNGAEIRVLLPGGETLQSDRPSDFPALSFTIPEESDVREIELELTSKLFQERLKIPVERRSAPARCIKISPPSKGNGFSGGKQAGSYEIFFEDGKPMRGLPQVVWLFQSGQFMSEQIFKLEGPGEPKPFHLKRGEEEVIEVYLDKEEKIGFANFLVHTQPIINLDVAERVRIKISSSRAYALYLNLFNEDGFKMTDTLKIEDFITEYYIEKKFIENGINCAVATRNPVAESRARASSCFFVPDAASNTPPHLQLLKKLRSFKPDDRTLNLITGEDMEKHYIAQAMNARLSADGCVPQPFIETRGERKAAVGKVRESYRFAIYLFLFAAALMNLIGAGIALIGNDLKLRRFKEAELAHPHSRWHILGILFIIALLWASLIYFLSRLWWGV